MEPLTVLAWIGVAVVAALAALVVWAVVQTIRGKTPRQQRERAEAERRAIGKPGERIL